MLVEGLLGDDGLLAGGLLVDDLVGEGVGGPGWAALPLVLRDLLLDMPPFLASGLLVDDLVGERVRGTSLPAAPLVF